MWLGHDVPLVRTQDDHGILYVFTNRLTIKQNKQSKKKQIMSKFNSSKRRAKQYNFHKYVVDIKF